MMLNTDLHNPAVRAKMSLAEFAENNGGVNGGHDRPSPTAIPIRAQHTT
jgi:Sec7-like guanine-nucleotide exchange factor